MMPALVISLDFELMWGMRDVISIDDHRATLDGTREVLPRILDLFASRGVSATWATVGLLFYDDREELLASLPKRKPSYANAAFSPYAYAQSIGRTERDDPYHFGRSLVRQIAACPGQEVGSHTFSHYYCLEAGQTAEEFEDDLRAAQAAAATLGLSLESLVFPRNQVSFDYLPICRDLGFSCFRGAQPGWMYTPVDAASNSQTRRAMRLLDAYAPLSAGSGRRATQVFSGLANVAADRFLRPTPRKAAWLEPLRLARICREMKAAVAEGRIYHLWWHPENFGGNPQANLAFLVQLLDTYRQLADDFGMQSWTMAQAALAAQPAAKVAAAS